MGILCSVGAMVAVMALPVDARPAMKWPEWSVLVSAFVSGVYLCGLAGTLFLRRVQPETGVRVTRALNMALLLAPPFGTALGLYGLWKVDRKQA
jgi:hypothetical protein